MSKTIEKQGSEGRLVYCANGPMRVSSPMSKTSSELGSEGNGGIPPMCLRQLRSKASREVWNIVPMCQKELARICLRLGQSKTLMKNGGVVPICLKPLRRRH